MAEGSQGFEQAARRVGQMITDVRRVERPLNQAGEYAISSIKRTILAGGRPKPFAPLAQSTIAARRKGKGRGGAKILIDRGRLLGSINKSVTTDGVRIGTNVSYAAVQHFGGRGAYTITPKNKKTLSFIGASGQRVSARSVRHPALKARPFMVLQREDATNIGKLFGAHLARK